ncbi:4719_t:CDS:2 [Dentiscutata erythropus]|uniref:4719_t:CDS:1 n=1 Tax=Dentiscutata erythropus TaxID=1348616 RepID=A0A9N9GC65_9GLOM|nr:4719_t:CDS:2 [Dentiscutata erythropus]
MKSHTGGKARHSFTPHINVIRVPNSKTAFNWVEKKSSIAMLKYKNPNLVIPSHHTLGDRVLKNTTQELHLELLQNDGIPINFAI